MQIRLVIPDVNAYPIDRPRACRHGGGSILQRHGSVNTPLKDHNVGQVKVVRSKCARCRKTFRHSPPGVTGTDQSRRTVVLAALMYGLGLSCSAARHLLRAGGTDIGKLTVGRDAQAVGEALRRKRPAGRVRVIGADETVDKVTGKEVVVGFVTDAETGALLGLEILVEGTGEACKEWLAPYVAGYGGEVLVRDDQAASGVAARELSLDHQVCITHVRTWRSDPSRS
jgi:hypothetical protein